LLNFLAGPHDQPQEENDVLALSSRDISENSNERFAGRRPGSGFIAVFDPPAEKIFSPDFAVETASRLNQSLPGTPAFKIRR
jgi:hypothetical protein